jgi:hypothetical protein
MEVFMVVLLQVVLEDLLAVALVQLLEQHQVVAEAVEVILL